MRLKRSTFKKFMQKKATFKNFYANFSKNQGGFNPLFQNSGGVATPPTPPTLAPLFRWDAIAVSNYKNQKLVACLKLSTHRSLS